MTRAQSTEPDLATVAKDVLDQVLAQPEIVAGAIYVLDERKNTLEQAASKGFPQDAVRETSISAGEGRFGRVVSTRRPVVSDVQLSDDSMTVHCVYPLNDRGTVRGVLEAHLSTPPDSVPGFPRVLDVLTSNAAATLRDAQELDDLRRRVRADDESCDKIVDAWSQTLNSRDDARRKHALRAAELTLKTGHKLGISEQDLVHARRGALLHDVGLTRVPESILEKPGKLTESEWEIMRLHPVYGYEILQRVPALYPSIDIPYCHHERWNGSGYPRGIEGTEIPLSARIFAVADVWIALCSHRPYRREISPEEACTVITDAGGSLFDPQVLEAFLGVVCNADAA
ncbi:MAG: HD domain-containing protein [Gemmatimonadetes bacterium]|nr:HD domain-containing protein [Gemmatimonadota bacterium]